jgi:hypothetical protein
MKIFNKNKIKFCFVCHFGLFFYSQNLRHAQVKALLLRNAVLHEICCVIFFSKCTIKPLQTPKNWISMNHFHRRFVLLFPWNFRFIIHTPMSGVRRNFFWISMPDYWQTKCFGRRYFPWSWFRNRPNSSTSGRFYSL